MTDIYIAHHEGIVQVHRALAEAFAPVVAGATTPLDLLVPQARRAANFLIAHHEMESTGLFPGLRQRGQLRLADVAFLDACDREHRALHDLAERLLAGATAAHPAAATIAELARETLALLEPHTREEERGLAPDRLRLMVEPDGLVQIAHDLEAIRPRVTARLAL